MEEERIEKRKEERRGRKEEEEDKEKNRECGAKDAPPPPDAFPSRRLGNNMTPIKGETREKHNSHTRRPRKADPKASEEPQQRQPNIGHPSHMNSIHPI